MLKSILAATVIPLRYAEAMLADITDAQWTRELTATRTHPASIMAHLAVVEAMTLALLTQRPPQLPAGLSEQLRETAQITPGLAYPRKEDLLTAWRSDRQGILDWLRQADSEAFARPVDNEYLAALFPTVGALAVTSLTVHESTHLGQLSAWRRAMDLELPI